MELQLTKGYVTVVDDDAPEHLLRQRWYASAKASGRIYARADKFVDGKLRRFLLHRMLLNAPPGILVDHINGDTLDNRVCNLRIATTAQNAYNSRVSRRNRSGFKGVHWDKGARKWRASIRLNGKLRHLGLFDSAILAAHAYDRAASELYGEFARLNFPCTAPYRPDTVRIHKE